MKTFDVAYLPTAFGANSSAGGHTALGSSYAEFNAKVPAAKVSTTVKASAKPKTLANAKGHTKVTATVKAASGTAKPTGTIKVMLGSKKVGTGTAQERHGDHHGQGHVAEEGHEQARRQVRPDGQLQGAGEVAQRHDPPHQVTPGGGPGSAPAHHRTSHPVTA